MAKGRMVSSPHAWLCLMLLLLLSSCPGSSNARGLFSFHRHQQQQEQSPAAAAPADSSKAAATPAAPLSSSSGDATTNSNSSNPGGLNNTDIPVDVGTAMTQLLKHAFKNQTLPPLKDILFPHLSANGSRNASRKHNFTWSDLAPPNMTLKQAFANAFKEALGNVTNGMSVSDFAKALMTGTISSNTADTNTPDRGLADVQSGAININPFVNGAALSNALTLAGRDATANSKGIVFGMIGTGRASSQATALGINGAKSSTDTFSVNGGGLLGQNAMSSNLAATPHGRADTSVRSAAFNMVGQTATGGLTMAVGKKGAASAGLGAGMTGFGTSRSSQFSNALSPGDTSSDTGVLAGTLTGASKASVGSVSTSLKKSAESQSLSTSKSALGSASSKSASLSTAAQNATSKSGSVASTGVGNVASVSSTTSTGMNADASANSNATSQAGAANSKAFSRAFGVTSAKSASTASSNPFASGVRDAPLLWTQRKRQSTTWSRSKSASNTLQASAQSGGGWHNPFAALLPSFLHRPEVATSGKDTTAPLLRQALLQSVGLKALLPSVPKITPQLPTLNQTVEVAGAAAACNETELNFNRTADQPRLRCNETLSNGTVPQVKVPDNIAGLPGIGFFKGLQDMNDKFIKDNNKSAGATGPSLLPKLRMYGGAASKADDKGSGPGPGRGPGPGGAGGASGSSSSTDSGPSAALSTPPLRQGKDKPAKPKVYLVGTRRPPGAAAAARARLQAT